LGIFFSLCSSQLTATIMQSHKLNAGPATVTLELTNSAVETVALLRWNLPLDNRFVSHSFNVQLNGSPVTYLGPVVKYAEPSEEDYIFIAPKRSITLDIHLQNYYDFSEVGTYYIFFDAEVLDYYMPSTLTSNLPRSKKEFTPYKGIISNRVHITTHESLFAKTVKAPYPCSSGEVNQINNAATSQKTMSSYAVDRIQEGQTPTFIEWFGAWNTGRHQTAQRCLNVILNNNVVRYECDDMANVYAYVYPSDTSHTIYVCQAFWPAPIAGGWDTKAGTIIHELSHFNNICGTNDWVYGVTGARNLARTNPGQAVNNADNVEYFCESLW